MKLVKKINFNKKDIIILISLIIFSILALVFVYNNYSFYKQEIVKVTNIKNVYTDSSTNTLGLTEKYYNQTIKGTIMNGKNKGDTITLTNQSTTSSVVTEKYKVNDDLLIKNSTISGLKRDKYVVLMIILFAISIFLVGKMQGLLAILSVAINSAIFYSGLSLYLNGFNLLLLCFIEAIFFTVFSLFITNGFNKKTLVAIISVLVSTIVLAIITLIVIGTTNYNGINFNSMSFLTVPVEDVFIAEIIIGGLGAIMDIAITISSSMAELIKKNKLISTADLIKSSKEIGNDIMGTMINILFFTYLCSGLPVLVLAIRNGYTLYNYITTSYSLEIARFFVGSIGIVLAIPITLFIALKFYKRSDK